ncbi:MAG: M23 family metallopeptidase, partial [bacterium]|nr:M23 family metallopeptidase [bacterium]
RGQLIGYSGETGAGFAHLHLEIRDPFQFALNPFKLVKFPARDNNSPVLRGLLFRNRGAAPLNGGIGEQYFRFKRVGKNRYAVTGPVVVTGPFDLLLNARDVSDTGRYVSPHEISASIDEHHYFNLRFDRFQWADNNQLGFVYDMFYSTSSVFYYNLFSQAGFTLEGKNIPLPRVVESLEEGEHLLKIQVRDNFNNVSTGVLRFHKMKKPELQLSGCTLAGNQIHLAVERLDAEAADDITINLKDRNENTIYSGGFKYRKLPGPKDFTLNGSFSNVCFVDFSFVEKGVVYFKKRFPVEAKAPWLNSITDIDFETFINRDEVFIKVDNPGLSPDNLRLTVIGSGMSKELNAESTNDSIYFHFKPANFFNKPLLLHFAVLQDGVITAEIQKKLHLVYLKKGVKRKFKYEEFGAEFAVRPVYEPKVLRLEERDYGSEFPVLSRQISLAPYHFPFLDTVYYTFSKNLPNPQQVGIFRYQPKSKKWRYRHTTYDGASKTYKRKVRSSGIYALMRDIYPPRISFRRVKVKYKKSLRRLVVTITDKGKGVNDNTLKVHLNGKRVDCEYDPDWRTVVIENLGHIKKGKNLLKVEIKDYAGHRSAKGYSFHLK